MFELEWQDEEEECAVAIDEMIEQFLERQL